MVAVNHSWFERLLAAFFLSRNCNEYPEDIAWSEDNPVHGKEFGQDDLSSGHGIGAMIGRARSDKLARTTLGTQKHIQIPDKFIDLILRNSSSSHAVPST